MTVFIRITGTTYGTPFEYEGYHKTFKEAMAGAIQTVDIYGVDVSSLTLVDVAKETKND